MPSWRRLIALIVLGLLGGCALVAAIGFASGREHFGEIASQGWQDVTANVSRQVKRQRQRAFCGDGEALKLAGRTDWRVEYSWAGGFGGGPLSMAVTDTGEFTLRLGTDLELRETLQLPAAEVAAFERAVDDSLVRCAETRRREDHRIIDLGTYDISIRLGTQTHGVRAGECHYIAVPESFSAVTDEFRRLGKRFETRWTDSPLGITTMAGACPAD